MDINQNVKALLTNPGALLVDVRTPEEYAAGHIPGSVNWPLERITLFDMEGGPIGVYCHSGSRSARAAAWLAQAGYEDVQNLGGIIDWTGPLES